jgi:threonine dehydrogenase-like Zn-dependent dehydrogenase
VGLLTPVEVPMDRVLAKELEILGSHGMAAHDYPELLALVGSGRLRPELLVTRELTLDEAGEALIAVGSVPGIAVVTSF